MNFFFWRKTRNTATVKDLIDELEVEIAGLDARRKELTWMIGNLAQMPARFAEEAVYCAERAARKRVRLQQLKAELRPQPQIGEWQ